MRFSRLSGSILQACALFATVSSILTVDPTSRSSLIAAAEQAATNLITFYDGYRSGGTIGMFDSPVYWWEAGAAWNAYLGFWHYTGNTTYNDVTKTSLLWQVGTGNDYLPANFSTSMGNDDQAFWAMAAMTAVEYNFTNPTGQGQPQWLALAQAVFNQQASRWDNANCGGGLRWQVFQFNTGYDYKNSVSNGAFFNIASRLARYTGNQTYADWAEKIWDWQLEHGFTNSTTFAVYDGATIPCTTINPLQWTYNNGLFMGGAAFMWNYTSNATWSDRVDKLIYRAKTDFFGGQYNDIIYEPACEPYDTCNVDQHSFKGYLARNMAYTMQMYPASISQLSPLLASSAKAAGLACGGSYGGLTQMCGFKWTWNNGTFDDSTAVGYYVGQNMAALETFQANLALSSAPPYTLNTGGTSQGDVAAGNTETSKNPAAALVITPATTADKAGAAILTVVASAGAVVFAWWIAL